MTVSFTRKQSLPIQQHKFKILHEKTGLNTSTIELLMIEAETFKMLVQKSNNVAKAIHITLEIAA